MKSFFTFILGLVCGIFLLLGMYGIKQFLQSQPLLSPVGQQIPEKPLDKYSIERLMTRIPLGSTITLDDAIATSAGFTVYHFHFQTAGKTVSGLAHVPNVGKAPFPVIVQLRGYVDHSIYESGIGTKRSAEVFASNGFLSLAPDFLGYGTSNAPNEDVFEERFQTYTTVLDLLASIPTLPIADNQHIGIWAHSNGGHIALAVLSILGTPIPTTLWAPVSKPFPYSILYYTDEADDGGRALRKKLAAFEADYDVNRFTMSNYIERIQGPIQWHQGSADAAVPQVWSDTFVTALKNKKKDILYYVYPGADHNMLGSWNTVVTRDIAFFQKEFAKKP